jgi:hypothetical protein
VKLPYIKMDEEDAQTDAEIQNEKKYIYAEPGNDKREFSSGSRKAFENDKSGEAENKRGEEYACPVNTTVILSSFVSGWK